MELLSPLPPRLAYKQRTESVGERGAQREAEGPVPQADSAFDHGVRTLELTRRIAGKGKHWVSELESSRPIVWADQWRRLEEGAAE